jgi:hypothetical protein
MVRLDGELHILARVDRACEVTTAHQRRIYSKITIDVPLSRFLLYVQRHTRCDIGSLIKNSTGIISGYVRIWHRRWRRMWCRCLRRWWHRSHSRYSSRNYGHSGSDYRLRRGCRFDLRTRCGCGNLSGMGCDSWKSGYSSNSRISMCRWCERTRIGTTCGI